MEKVSAASAKGGRPYQEDRFVCERLDASSGVSHLLAVFDGHGGTETSELASQELVSLIKTSLKTYPGDIPSALRHTFQKLHLLTSEHRTGSTASVVLISDKAQWAYLAILGDSPVAVLDHSGVLTLAPDHNVRTNLKERSAAIARGGSYVGGYLEDAEHPGSGLQMTRALGDVSLNRVLLREPEIVQIPLGGRGIVLAGTDGLWLDDGTFKDDQLKRMFSMVQKGADAQAIVAEALERMAEDNVTAIVWRCLDTDGEGVR